MTTWPPLATALAASMIIVRPTGIFAQSALLSSLLVCEAAHHCYATISARASGRSHTRPERSGASQLELWRKCLEEDATISAATLIRGWFLPSQHKGAAARTMPRLDELRRGNVEEFLAQALHSARVDELDSVGRSELEASVCMTEERIAREEALPGFRFKAGYNPQLSAMTLNIDPPSLTMQPRPLLYYFLTHGVKRVTGAVMRLRGFHRYREGKLTYWHHPGDVAGEREGAEATPLVFVHGVGLGLTPYLGWLRHLGELRAPGGRRPPMLLLELPFVSQRLGGLRSLPQERRTADEIGRAMARHGLPCATFIGHSLGTVYLSWVAKLRPELLASCVFIDPIVFLLHQRKVRPSPMLCVPSVSPLVPSHALSCPLLPSPSPACSRRVQVAHSFIYDKPAADDPQAQVETFFVKSERSTATYFHRHFYWFSNILWADELPAPSLVVLAEEDTIVPVENVAAYLRGAQAGEKAGSDEVGSEAACSEALSSATRAAGLGTSAVKQVVTLKGQRHGQFLIDEEARDRVLSAVADAQAWARRNERPRARHGRAASPDVQQGQKWMREIVADLQKGQTKSLPSWAALLVATPKVESSLFPRMAPEEAFAL